MSLTALVIWIIVGLIVGLLAKSIDFRKGGLPSGVIVCLAGALIIGWLFSNVFHLYWGGFYIGSIINALIGAFMFLQIARVIIARRTTA